MQDVMKPVLPHRGSGVEGADLVSRISHLVSGEASI